MTERVEWIPDSVWSDIVEHVPIPSVDLLVVTDNGLLLAKRQNEPAKGEWFVPGGRIQKGGGDPWKKQSIASRERNWMSIS